MQALKIDYSKTKSQKTKATLLGIINVGVGITALYLCSKEDAGAFFWTISAIYFFLGIIFLIGLILRFNKYIVIDESGIDSKLSAFSGADKTDWSEMTKTEIRILQINIYTRSGKIKTIKLSGLPYSDVKNIKLKVFGMCLQEKVPCSVKSLKKGRSRER